jgi:hypothetical protein
MSPDQRAVVVGADAKVGGEARAWSWEKPGEPLGPPLHHPDAVVEVSFEADGKTVRTRDARHVVRRWDFVTGRQLEPPVPIPADTRLVAINAAGTQCLAHGPSGSLQLIGQDGKFVVLAAASAAEWKCASFSGDGRWILSGWSDGVRLWDASTGRAIGPPVKLMNLNGVEFVPNRNAIVAWSATEVKWLPLQFSVFRNVADWRPFLRGRTGVDWPVDGVPRFLDAAEWRRAAAR